MTHEHTPGDEPDGGPQHDHRLPDALDVPVADGPFDLVGLDRPYDQDADWDDETMSPRDAEELAAAVALGLDEEETFENHHCGGTECGWVNEHGDHAP